MQHSLPQRRGVVLLMSLILMAAITAGTIAVAVLLIRTNRQTVSLDNFITASLGADTGVERSLAIIKAGRASYTLEETIAALGQASTPLTGSKAGYSVAASSQATAVPTSLANGQAFGFDVLKTSASVAPSHYLSVRSDSCVPASGPCGTLRVSWTLISSTGNSYSGIKSMVTGPSSGPIDLNQVFSPTSNDPGPPSSGDINNITGYRVQIQAVSAGASNIVAQPCDMAGSNCVPSAQGSIQLNAYGTLQNTQALKTANVLWQLPSSGVFNFVLFTEGSIIPPT